MTPDSPTPDRLIPDDPSNVVPLLGHDGDPDDEDPNPDGMFPPDAPELSDAYAKADEQVRFAAMWVDEELERLRSQRVMINDRVRELVAEQARLQRLVRVLNDKS